MLYSISPMVLVVEATSALEEQSPGRRRLRKVGYGVLIAFAGYNIVANAVLQAALVVPTYFGDESPTEAQLEAAILPVKDMNINCLSKGSILFGFDERVQGGSPSVMIGLPGTAATMTIGTPDIVNLRDDICSKATTALTRIGTNSQLRLDEIDAWGVILHEKEHTDGVRNEAEAECSMAQAFGLNLMNIGFSETQAIMAAVHVWYSGLTDNYYDPEKCRPGGAYDLKLQVPYPFPALQK